MKFEQIEPDLEGGVVNTSDMEEVYDAVAKPETNEILDLTNAPEVVEGEVVDEDIQDLTTKELEDPDTFEGEIISSRVEEK